MIDALARAATPAPSTSSTTSSTDSTLGVDADLVTPGLGGFLLLFFLALAVYFLGRSMARRVRGVNVRARLEEEAEAERQAGEAQRSPAGTPDEEPPAREPRD